MSYTALYRKWRPKNFNDVIGQNHIVKTLKNQISSGRIAHAYLFCGTRGTGKTSTAKIFAKAVNCENPLDSEPCGQCQVCQNINRSMNVIEIDAASNNGVDNIRDIVDEVKYPPTEGKYKVYIIDEVHMLSIGAFNALLKTLEEPPSHVIFILATTDPQKIPATILSRCQRYDFKRIPLNDMTQKLNYYMEKENIEIDIQALEYIARIADGAMRDALSILDQCVSFYYGQHITMQNVLDTLGNVDNRVFSEIVDSIIKNDSAKCMDIVESIVIQGRDIRQFVSGLISYLRDLIVIKTSQTNIFNISNIEYISNQSKSIDDTKIINLIQEFSSLDSKLKYSSNDRILLEVMLIKLCKQSIKSKIDDYSELLERISKLESNIANGTISVNVQKQPKVQKQSKPKHIAVPKDIKEHIDDWAKLKVQNKLDKPLNSMIEDTEADYLDNNFYYIKCQSEFCRDYIDKKKDILIKELESISGKVFQLKPILETDFQYQYNKLYGKAEENSDKDLEFESILKTLNLKDVNVETID